MHSHDVIKVPLLSHPGTFLTLPEGSQVLTPQAPVNSTPLERAQLVCTIQARLCQERMKIAGLTGRQSCRVLLLLPDKTRRQTAARLTLDALLELCEQAPGWSLEIVFGLGTHPLMQAEEIEQMLGHTRLQRLQRLGSALHQQSTLASLPLRPLRVTLPTQADSEAWQTISTGEVLLEVPEILWKHDMILVAGDTDLHPYEGRAGSGGIHKMIAIGIGCLSTIRITHSMGILTHSKTRPGEAKNRFVEAVDHFAGSIINALMSPAGNLHCAPLGISVLARKLDQPDAFWIGNHEEERARLLDELKVTRSLELESPVNLVVADTEPEKATDLLAGARSLHFLCCYDDDKNRLLCQASPCRTALMYNACHQLCNANGIGNKGTVLHLKALKAFALETLQQAAKSNSSTLHGSDANPTASGFNRKLKTLVLSRWERYLNLVSQEDAIFARLEELLLTHAQRKAPRAEVLALLTEEMPNSFGPHWHVLNGTHGHLQRDDPATALQFLREALETLGFKGLGEGGQRALRLLSILRKFDQLLVATKNQAVLDFLNHDQPGPTGDAMPSPSRPQPGRVAVQPITAFALVGLFGLSLEEYSPQQCLNLAIDRHLQAQEHCKTLQSGCEESQLRLAFLQEPVILMRPKFTPLGSHQTQTTST